MLTQRKICSYLAGLSLRARLLLPFSAILLALGIAATFGTHLLIRETLLRTADQRLHAVQETFYREIKNQEFLLLGYANIVKLEQYPHANAQASPLHQLMQDHLLTLLANSRITASLYPMPVTNRLGQTPLEELFKQSKESGKPRFRLLVGEHGETRLSVASPIPGSTGDTAQILLMQTPIDRVFLEKTVEPFSAKATILTLDQQTLVTTETQGASPLHLSLEEVSQIAQGESLLRTIDAPVTSRQLFAAIPLGNSDLVLLAVELPLSDLDTLLATLFTRTGISILIALLLGMWLYIHLIRQVTAPLQKILLATREIGQGNLACRISTDASGEMKELSDSLNLMLEQLDNLYQQKSDQEQKLAFVNEKLRFTEIVEQKNQEIERTNRELKVHLREISTLLQLNQMMNSTLELNAMFERTLGLLRDLLAATDVVLLLYNPEEEKLEVCKALGHDQSRFAGVVFHLAEGITGLAAHSRELLYVRDTTKDERYLNYKGKLSGRGSMVSAPILIRNKLIGVINLHKPKTDDFTETELKMIQAAANQLAVAIENAQLFEQTKTLSNTDDLTGLANRRHFQELLRREFAQAGRYHDMFSLIMIDIDHFKNYNDTYGHLSGDVVLRRVAALLLQHTRGIDLVARFGGEEFIILLPKTSQEGALAAAEKLRKAVEGEVFLAADQTAIDARVTISLGIASFPASDKDVFELIHRADQALYAAKAQGRNRAVVWGETLTSPPPPSTDDGA